MRLSGNAMTAQGTRIAPPPSRKDLRPLELHIAMRSRQSSPYDDDGDDDMDDLQIWGLERLHLPMIWLRHVALFHLPLQVGMAITAVEACRVFGPVAEIK